MILCCVPLVVFLVPSDGICAQANLDSLKKAFVRELEQTPSPEFDNIHRAVHQNGCANVLYEEMKQNSLSALLAFVRMKLQKAFSIPQTTLVKVIPQPNLEIRTPVVFHFPTGTLVFDWRQIKIYRHALAVSLPDPWEKGRHER